MHIFTYGSLMYGQVWHRVVQGKYASKQAALSGYQCRQIKGDHYPVLIPGTEGDTVAGKVYLDLTPSDLSRLDAFEGDYYERRAVTIQDTGCQPLSCQTYVLKPVYAQLASETAWSPEQFEAKGLREFLEKYFGFDLIR